VLGNKWIHFCMGVVLEDSSHKEKLEIQVEEDKATAETSSVKITSLNR